MNRAFPIIPKRRLVAARAWDREPESRQLTRNHYRSRITGIVNPWIISQLKSEERFTQTPSDSWRKD